MKDAKKKHLGRANDQRGHTENKLSRDPTAAIRSTSTATEAQLRKLAALARIAPRHTYELRAHGISHPAGRVRDLQSRGYVFESHRITTVDPEGFLHRGVALYELVQEPLEAM